MTSGLRRCFRATLELWVTQNARCNEVVPVCVSVLSVIDTDELWVGADGVGVIEGKLDENDKEMAGVVV